MKENNTLKKMILTDLYVPSDSYRKLFEKLSNKRNLIIRYILETHFLVVVKGFWNFIPIDSECKCNLGKLDYASKSKCISCKIISRLTNIDNIIMSKSFNLIYGDNNKKLVIYEEPYGTKIYMETLKKWLFENFINDELEIVPENLRSNIDEFIKVDNTTMGTICEWYTEYIFKNKEYHHSICCEMSFICNNSYYTLKSYRNDAKYIPLLTFIKTANVKEMMEILYQLFVMLKSLRNLYYGNGVEGIYVFKKNNVNYLFPINETSNININARVCISTFTDSALIVENNNSRVLYFSENIFENVITNSVKENDGIIFLSPIYGYMVSFNLILNQIISENSFKRFLSNKIIYNFIEKITEAIFTENFYNLTFVELENELIN